MIDPSDPRTTMATDRFPWTPGVLLAGLLVFLFVVFVLLVV
jgi:hypothetical protein